MTEVSKMLFKTNMVFNLIPGKQMSLRATIPGCVILH